ncbi:MAG: MoaD/ThiS family protein [Gemmatimonadota bacterium]
MPITVRVPTVLQKLTNGADEVYASGDTVAEVFAALRTSHIELVNRITTPEGGVKPFLNVFVNGDDIRFASELQTPVRDGDELSIIPSIAGG